MGGPAVEVAHGVRTRPELALTFHGAGEVGIARELLAIFAAHRARVTVLAVGTWLAGSPHIAREIIDAGHELGNAGAAGYRRVLSYDVDSLDYTDPGPDAIRRAVASAQPGSIVSMHFGHPGTVTAMPSILADLTSRGLAAVTATQLLRA